MGQATFSMIWLKTNNNSFSFPTQHSDSQGSSESQVLQAAETQVPQAAGQNHLLHWLLEIFAKSQILQAAPSSPSLSASCWTSLLLYGLQISGSARVLGHEDMFQKSFFCMDWTT